jgi:hypothetical protein
MLTPIHNTKTGPYPNFYAQKKRTLNPLEIYSNNLSITP